MSAELVGRVISRMNELGLNPRSASLASELNATFIRDLTNRPNASPSAKSLEKLARGLQTTPQWLAFGEGEVVAVSGPSPAPTIGGDVTASPTRKMVRPLYGGVVEAGSFREVNDFDDPDRIVPLAEEDPRFPGVPIISFDVAGDSMNALQPTPILPGWRVIAIDFEGLRNRVPLRDGMVVIVEQSLNGGHLRERSVKQLEMHRDRTEFCPRSTNAKHKPIVVPFDIVDQGDEDGREVKVLAIVRQVISDLPGW